MPNEMDNEWEVLPNTPQIENEWEPVLDLNKESKPDTGMLDRFTAGLGEAQSSFRTNIVNPVGEFIGGYAPEIEGSPIIGFSPEERIQKDLEAQQQMASNLAVEEQYLKENPEAWNISGGLGKYAPDIATGIVSKAKALGTGAYDFGLEYSRTGDVKKAMAAGVLGAAGYKVLEKAGEVLAKPTKTAFGKAIDKLGLDEKKAMTEAVNTMDNLGIDRMDEVARSKILNEIDLTKSTKEVSAEVTERLMQMKNRARAIKNNEYAKADELARSTRTVDGNAHISAARVDDKGQVLDISNMTKAERKVFKDIKTRLERSNDLTAEGIEKRIQELSKEAFKKANESEKYLYDRTISSLRKDQELLLSEKGLTGIYDMARQADKEYKTRYMGSIDDFGAKAGKRVASVLKAQNNSDVSTAILGRRFDKNVAEQVSREFGKQTRRDMVMDVLTKDVSDMDNPVNIGKFIDNFEKASPEGLRYMLGKEAHDTLTKNIDALKLVESTIIERNKQNEGIIKNVISLLGATAASNISPYASLHVGINESKNIANKILAKKSRDGLIKRLNTIEDKTLRRTLLSALKMATTPTATVIADKTKISELLNGDKFSIGDNKKSDDNNSFSVLDSRKPDESLRERRFDIR